MYAMRKRSNSYSFVCGCPVVPAPFVEKTVVLFHQIILAPFPNYQLTIDVKVYFWALSYVYDLCMYQTAVFCLLGSLEPVRKPLAGVWDPQG